MEMRLSPILISDAGVCCPDNTGTEDGSADGEGAMTMESVLRT